jgi:hypothetical protein
MLPMPGIFTKQPNMTLKNDNTEDKIIKSMSQTFRTFPWHITSTSNTINFYDLFDLNKPFSA